VTLADLAPSEKYDFVNRWCELTELPNRRADAARELISDVHSTDRIERMTGNPMLLTTMALVKRKVGKLPNRRAELYGEAVQVLLNWRQEVDEPLDPHEAIPQLEYVAFAMCDQGVQRLRRDEILKVITQMREDYPNIHQARNHSPEEFLSRLEARTGLLVEAGRTRHHGLEEMVYEFRHLTFQEYLAACAFVDGRFPGKAAKYSLAEHVAPLAGRTSETAFIEDGAKEMAVLETWRETLRLSLAICLDDDVDSTLHAILTPMQGEPEITSRARSILAVLCIADEPNVSEAMVVEVFEQFAAQVDVRDRNFSVRTGVHVAADSVAATNWAMLLCNCLVAEFLRQEPLRRDYWGDIAAIVYAKTSPSKADLVSDWRANQIETLHNGTEFQAIQVALGIAALARTRNAVDITPELISVLLARLTGTAPMSHAAAEALAYLTRDTELDGQTVRNLDERVNEWIPNELELEQIVAFVKIYTNDPEAIRFLTWLLGKRKVQAAVVPLMTWLDHPSAELRKSVVASLGSIKGELAIEPLVARLGDAEADVGYAAAIALGEIGSNLAAEPLIARLEHVDALWRSTAAMALGTLRCEFAVEPLIERLQDIDSDVCSSAVIALGEIGNELAVVPLVARLNKVESDVNTSAAKASGDIEDEYDVEHQFTRIEVNEAYISDVIVRVLGEIGGASALTSLYNILGHKDKNLRQAAVGSLSRTCEEEVDKKLLSRDFDDFEPYLDPRERVKLDHVRQAAQSLEISIEEVRHRYETLASKFRLKLTWRSSKK
jgi:HEAT repeat protein